LPKFGPLLVAGVLASATASAETHTEAWPELQLWYRFDPTARLLFNPAPTHSRESDDRSSIDWGVYLDYRPLKDPASYRIGYVYSISEPTAQGRRTENRIVLDYTYSWVPGHALKLLNRVRLDLRDRQGESSQRLRDRVQLEYETQVGELPVVPYANFELVYDTRYDAVARYKGEAGATFAFSPQADLTLYLGRQTDTQPSRVNVNAVGVVLGLHF
jgi:hypothetical protein